MTDGDTLAARAREELGFSRWWLIIAAAGAMGVVSPYQYVWSSIEGPIARDLGVPLPALGLVFTLFVVFQAGSQFPVGRWRDEHGPRELTALAAILAGGSYVGLSVATSVTQLYLLYSLGAVGVGIVYTVAVNTALKWFPDRRGLTTGVGTMAFAGGAAAFVPFVRANATVDAYQFVLQVMGAIIFLVLLVAAVVLRDPPEGYRTEQSEESGENDGPDGTSDGERSGSRRQYSATETLTTWQFYVMYAMFVGVSGAGLMVTAKVVSFAQAAGMTSLTATVSATVLPIAAGGGRLVMGDLSDRLEPRYVMAGSFTLCGVGVASVAAAALADSSVGFVLAVVAAVFFWSPQYTLFPTLIGRYYGEMHSSSNYALLYSGKVWGGVFGGAVAGWIVASAGWTVAFGAGATLALAAGGAALLLRPVDGTSPTGHADGTVSGDD